LQHFLIKFLLLLSASLSLHSALALPLSSVLESNYHAVAESNEEVEEFNTNIALNDFAYKQFTHSKLQSGLLTLLRQNNDDDFIIQVLLSQINRLDIDLAQIDTQSQIKRSYQEQVSTHTYILSIENTSYRQKTSYQAKLQQQHTS
jgi:hypothetical protein